MRKPRLATSPDLERIPCASCHVRDLWAPAGTVLAYTCPRCAVILATKAPAQQVTFDPIRAARARHRAKMRTAAGDRRKKGR